MKIVNPRVSEVTTTTDYELIILFTNGETGIYDCSDLLDFSVFTELRDKHYFSQARVVDGTVAWPNGQDICPDTLYLEAMKSLVKKK